MITFSEAERQHINRFYEHRTLVLKAIEQAIKIEKQRKNRGDRK